VSLIPSGPDKVRSILGRRKTGVLIDLKRHRTIWEDFWDGLVSESRREEKSVPYEQYRAAGLKRSRPRE
jgi:hypothetical protein